MLTEKNKKPEHANTAAGKDSILNAKAAAPSGEGRTSGSGLKGASAYGEAKKDTAPSEGHGPAEASMLAMIRENLQYNLGTLLLGLLVMLFNSPILMALSLSDLKRRLDDVAVESVQLMSNNGATSVFMAEKITDIETRMSAAANELLSGATGLMAFIVPVAALLCARAMFIYLMNRPTVDFYLSEPVSRTKRFFANYFSGAVIMLICMVFGFVGSHIVAICFGVKDINVPAALLAQFGYLLIFLLLYSTFIIAIMLTGRPFAAVAAAVVIHGLGIAVYGILSGYFNLFETFSYKSVAGFEKLYYTTPLYYLIEFVSEISSRAGVFGAGAIKLMGITAVLDILLIAISAVLHRIRPSEACGRTLSFSRTALPLRLILSVVGGLLISFFGFTEPGIGWILFFLVLGTLIAHAICEISFNMDIRKLFSHKIEKLICVIAGAAFALVFILDPFGYDSYMPDTEDLESVAFSYGGDFEGRLAIPLSDYELRVETETPDIKYTEKYYDERPDELSRMAITEEPYVEAVLSLLKIGADRASAINDNDNDIHERAQETSLPEDNFRVYSVDAVYRLKNGKVKYRTYVINNREIKEHMPEIFTSMEYKTALYPILELSENELSPGIFGIEFKEPEFGKGLTLRGELDGTSLGVSAQSNIDWEDNVKVYRLPEDELQAELLSALKQDITDMRYEDYYDWSYSVYKEVDDEGVERYHSDSDLYRGEQQEGTYIVDDVLHFVPASSVKLAAHYNNISYEDIDGNIRLNYVYYDYQDIYPIFESFDNVRAVLSERGLIEE